MSHQYATLEDTIYFWFGANDTSGSGNDGATPVYDVRLGGAAADAIPTLSGAATLLTHANYPAGAHEIAVAATDGNGFAAGNTYGVFCTLLVDSQNPTGFVGSFTLAPVPADAIQVNSNAAAAANLKSACDNYSETRGLTGTALPAEVGGASGGVFLGSTGGKVAATGLDLVLKTSTYALAMADAIWDEILTGATHNIATSAGRRLRQAEAAVVLSDGTAQGGTASTIQLEAGENANDDWYNATRIVLTGGTGVGQSRHIHDYTGDTVTADIEPNWVTNPGADTVYEIYPQCYQDAHTVLAGGITASSFAAGAIDAAAIAAAAIDNATFAADVGSTVYASNIIALAVRKAINDYAPSTHDAAAVWTAGSRALSTPADYKADVSGLSTHDAAAVWTAENRALSTPADYKADVSGLSTHDAAAVVAALGTGSTLTSCTTATGFLDAAGVRTAVGLSSANLDTQIGTLATPAQVNAQVLDVLNVDTLVAGVTMAEALRRIGAITSGVISGAGTGIETFKDYEGSVKTVVVTVDASGNRSGIAYN